MAPTPHVYTTSDLFEKVKILLRKVKASHPEIKRVFDSPAGAGALSFFLKEELGYDVVASDIDAHKWEYKSIQPLIADLGRPLPLKDSEMDAVFCLEGIKHLTDVSTAISEMARILKPGGLLLLTIPNDLCMQTRLRYFFDGFVDTDWHHPLDSKSLESKNYLYVNSLLSLPYLYYFLEKNDFKLLETHASRLRAKSVILTVLFYPLIYFFTRKACKPTHPIFRELTSLTWLAGRHNILLCEKSR